MKREVDYNMVWFIVDLNLELARFGTGKWKWISGGSWVKRQRDMTML